MLRCFSLDGDENVTLIFYLINAFDCQYIHIVKLFEKKMHKFEQLDIWKNT